MAMSIDPVRNWMTGAATAAIIGSSTAVPIREANLESKSDVIRSAIEFAAGIHDAAEARKEAEEASEISEPVDGSAVSEVFLSVDDASNPISDYLAEFELGTTQPADADTSERGESSGID